MKILRVRFMPDAGFPVSRDSSSDIVRVDGGFAIGGRWVPDHAVAEVDFEGEWDGLTARTETITGQLGGPSAMEKRKPGRPPKAK